MACSEGGECLEGGEAVTVVGAQSDSNLEQAVPESKDEASETQPSAPEALHSTVGLSYPSYSAKELYNGVSLLLMVLFIWCPTAVQITYPEPPSRNRALVWLYIPTIAGLSFWVAQHFITYAAPSLRATLACLALTFVSCFTTKLLIYNYTIGFPWGWLLLSLGGACFKLQGQWRLSLAAWFFATVCLYGVGMLFRFLPLVLEKLQAAVPRGLLPPLVASFLGSVYPFLLFRAVPLLGRRGLPPTVGWHIALNAEVLVGSIRLGTMIVNAKQLDEVLWSFVFMIAADACFRFALWERLCARVGWPRSLWGIRPGMDVCLRVKYSATYMAALHAVWIAGFAGAAGAAWARKWSAWVPVVLAYIIYNILLDTVLVVLHRTTPSETLAATITRLSTQPRANWPSLHMDDAPIDRTIWKPSCASQIHSNGDIILVAFAQHYVTNVVVALFFASVETFCYITRHPGDCDGRF